MPGLHDIDPGRLPERLDALHGIEHVRRLVKRVPAYLVGGAVRDLLLGRERTDLDVVIEGNVEALADIPGFVVEREGLFLTGKLALDDTEIDVAQARAESYPKQGVLPEVRPASITEDLARRGFTINALAVALTGGPELLDPHP